MASNKKSTVNEPARSLLKLQRTVGNQAVGRLLRSHRTQAKLRLSQPGDRFEREADRVADAVMRMPEPRARPLEFSPSQPTPAGRQEHAVQRDAEERAEKSRTDLRLAKNANQPPGNPLRSAEVAQRAGGQGRPLPESVQAFFGARFGRDFSSVRVHTNARASALARAFNARAYTMGRHIVFGAGQYKPASDSGRRLLAHELVHVLQQTQRPTLRRDVLATAAPPAVELNADGPLLSRQEAGLSPAGATSTADDRPRIEVATVDSGAAGPAANDNKQLDEKPDAEPVEDLRRPEQRVELDIPPATPESKPKEPAEVPPATTPAGPPVAAAEQVTDLEPTRGASRDISNARAEKGPSEPKRAEDPDALLSAVASAPATAVLTIYNRAVASSSTVLAKQTAREEESLPKIQAPTGMPAHAGTQRRQRAAIPKRRMAPSRFAAEKKGKTTDPNASLLRSKPIRAQQQFRGTDRLLQTDTNDGVATANAEAALANVRVDTDRIPDRLGPRPTVNLSGGADPSQADGFQAESRHQVAAARTEALALSRVDFGERGVFPAPDRRVIASKQKLTAARATAQPLAPVQAVPAEVQADIDETMGARLRPALEQEQGRYREADARYRASKARAESDTNARVTALSSETEAMQQTERAKVRSQVAGLREQWRGEVNKADAEFQRKSARATQNEKAKIHARQRKGEQDAAHHFAKAETEARAKKGAAVRATEREKAKVKNRSKGFFSWVGSKIAGFFEGLKRAVTSIFNELKAAVQHLFDKAKKLAMGAIEAARSAIVGMIRGLGSVLKGLVNVVFAAFPQIASKINAKIDGAVESATKAVNAAARKLKAGVAKALDVLASVTNGLLSVVQAGLDFALTAMSFIVRGELGQLGRYIVQSALKLAGATLGKLMQVLGINEDDVAKIIDNPVGFLGNLVGAVKQGLFAFRDNIAEHLRAGLAAWLFGTFANAGIELPKSFDLASIFSFIAQILGLTYQAIRARLVKLLGPKGEQMVSAVEQGFQFIKDLITRGPIVLWERVKDFLGNLKEMLLGSLIGWLRNTIIVKAIVKLVSFFNPAGAIVQAIQAIYNTAMFFVERSEQIKAFAQSVFNSIRTIAEGNVGAAAAFVEQSLARAIPVIISFLARLLGLGGIVERVKKAIATIKAPIDKAIDTVLGWLVGVARSIWAKLKGIFPGKRGTGLSGRDRTAKRRDLESGDSDRTLGEPVAFRAAGERHQIWIDPRSGRLMMKSETTPLEAAFLHHEAEVKGLQKTDKETASKVHDLVVQGQDLSKKIKAREDRIKSIRKKGKKKSGKKTQQDMMTESLEIDRLLEKLTPIVKQILEALNIAPPEKINPKIGIEFKMHPWHSEKEYKAQLKGQETAINAMNVGEWWRNRYRYTRGLGRDPDASVVTKERRREIQKEIVRVLKGAGIPKAAAQKAAKDLMSDLAILHEPDGVAGGVATKIRKLKLKLSGGKLAREGDADKAMQEVKKTAGKIPNEQTVRKQILGAISEMGNQRINSSIGTQWPSLIDERVVPELTSQLKGIAQTHWDETKMQMKLKAVERSP